MRIGENNINTMDIWFNQKNSVGNDDNQTKETVFENKQNVEQEEKTLSDYQKYIALCKEFPNVSFVVVDEIQAPIPEYSGICDTSAFGDLNQVSIELHIEVLKNLDKDYDNIIRMIHSIADDYGQLTNSTIASGCSYTAINIHYLSEGELSFWQFHYFDAPTGYRELGKEEGIKTLSGINEKYLQAFLMDIQNEAINKLFQIGKNEEQSNVKFQNECAKNYEKQFIYE